MNQAEIITIGQSGGFFEVTKKPLVKNRNDHSKRVFVIQKLKSMGITSFQENGHTVKLTENFRMRPENDRSFADAIRAAWFQHFGTKL